MAPRGSSPHSSSVGAVFPPECLNWVYAFLLVLLPLYQHGSVLNWVTWIFRGIFWKDFNSFPPSTSVHLLQNCSETQFRWQSGILLSPSRRNYPLRHKALGITHTVGHTTNVCFESKTKNLIKSHINYIN